MLLRQICLLSTKLRDDLVRNRPTGPYLSVRISFTDMFARARSCRGESRRLGRYPLALTNQIHLGRSRKYPSDLSEALQMELQRLFFVTHPQH
jgi:hypothetical protein